MLLSAILYALVYVSRAVSSREVLLRQLQASTEGLNLTGIPTDCQDTCNGAVRTIATCGTLLCICSDERQTDLRACVDCIVAVRPDEEVIAQGQTILDQFAGNCAVGNITIDTQTVSGFTAAATSLSSAEVLGPSTLFTTFSSIPSTSASTAEGSSNSSGAETPETPESSGVGGVPQYLSFVPALLIPFSIYLMAS